MEITINVQWVGIALPGGENSVINELEATFKTRAKFRNFQRSLPVTFSLGVPCPSPSRSPRLRISWDYLGLRYTGISIANPLSTLIHGNKLTHDTSILKNASTFSAFYVTKYWVIFLQHTYKITLTQSVSNTAGPVWVQQKYDAPRTRKSLEFVVGNPS